MREATVVFFFRRDGKVLLFDKLVKYCAGRKVGPGGKRRPSETIRRCAGRESKEECGLVPKKVRLLGAVTCHNKADKSDMLVYMFRADARTGKLRESKTLKNPRWYPTNAKTLALMMEGDSTWFQHIIDNTEFEAKVWYDEDWHLDRAIVKPLDPKS